VGGKLEFLCLSDQSELLWRNSQKSVSLEFLDRAVVEKFDTGRCGSLAGPETLEDGQGGIRRGRTHVRRIRNHVDIAHSRIALSNLKAQS